MNKKNTSARIKTLGAPFLHYYAETEKKIESAKVGNRTLTATKARQAIHSESLRFAKRNYSDLIDWALYYTLDSSHHSNVVSMSGAPKCDTPEAIQIRSALTLSLDIVSRFNPHEAEKISYNLVVGVLHQHKAFVKDLSSEQATAMIQDAIDLAMGHYKAFEDQARTVVNLAMKEQRKMVFRQAVRKYAGLGLMVSGGVTALACAFFNKCHCN
jgi:hypothetical protein